jgi:glycosyltransferase involved in cell wall biosynthesis
VSELAFSVVICTRNRAALLDKAIASLRRQTLGLPFEVVVVDNDSSDRTPALVRQAMPHLPLLRYVHEPTLGLSHARNRGWREARGQWIAFLDDDAVADVNWLASLHATIGRLREPCGGIGGRVLLDWEAPRPAWFPDNLLVYLGHLDRGGEARWCDPGQTLLESNLAIRRDVLEQVGGFDVRLGVCGSKLAGNDGAELQHRIAARGLRLYYEPAAVVHHFVGRYRLKWSWVWRRLYGEGRSLALMELPRARGRTGYVLDNLRVALRCGAAVPLSAGALRTQRLARAACALGKVTAAWAGHRSVAG